MTVRQTVARHTKKLTCPTSAWLCFAYPLWHSRLTLYLTETCISDRNDRYHASNWITAELYRWPLWTTACI